MTRQYKNSLAILGLSAALFCFFPLQAQSKDTHFNQGINYFKNRDFEKAILEFKDAMEEEPTRPEAFSYYADACIYYKEWSSRSGATSVQDRALEVYNENFKNIEPAYKKAIELKPNFIVANMGLMKFYASINKKAEAIATARAFLNVLPGIQEDIEAERRLSAITSSDEYKQMILELKASKNEPLSPDMEALQVFNDAIQLVRKGQLQSQTAKDGLKNLKAAIDNFTDYPKQAVKYSYQAEMDFSKALKAKPLSDEEALGKLLKAAQKLDSEATYIVGAYYLNNGSSNELGEIKAQFNRIHKINPDFKNIGELLNTPKVWVSIGRVQSIVREVQGRIEQFKERENAVDFERETIQEYILDPLTQLDDLPKEIFKDPTAIESLRTEGQQLADKASRGFPKVKLLITLDRKKVPNNLFVTLPSRTRIETKIKGDLSDINVVFITDAAVIFSSSTTSATVIATAKSEEIPPTVPRIVVAANSTWKFLPTSAAGCAIRKNLESQPFDTNFFGELDFPGYRKLSDNPHECSWDSNKCMTVKNLKSSYVD